MALSFNGSEPKNITYNGNEVKKVVFNGNTVWEEEVGNILVINDMNLNKNGYNLVVEDGVITLNGAQTSWFNGELNFETNVQNLEPGNYICKITHISDPQNSIVAVKLIQSNYVQIVNANFYNIDQTIPFEVTANVTRLYLYISSQWSYSNKKFKIEIFKA